MMVVNEIVLVNNKYHIKSMVGLVGSIVHDGVSYSEIEPLDTWKAKGFKGIFSIPNDCLE